LSVPIAEALTATGVVRLKPKPYPNWPTSPRPQHWTVPSWRRAQACLPPAAISTTFVSPVTATGVALSVVVPFPNWPTLFAPQHRTSPFWSRAQVYPKPAAIPTTPLSPCTSIVGELPPRADASPQQRTVPSDRRAQV
jgi:hypothetical protein